MRLLKSISYTLFSNILSILVSAIVVLVVPKFIGVHAYGLWQLFIFYSGYVGILHLGWADGIFLRRGGQSVDEIDISSLMTETVLFILFNTLIGLVIFLYGIWIAQTYSFIIAALGVTVILFNVRTWITMILQSIGNFRGYAINLTAQSLVYLLLVTGILISREANYQLMIVAFIVSQLATCVSGFIQLKNSFPSFSWHWNFADARIESKLNVNSGFKLMVANSTAILIIGVIRMGIQRGWSVSVFGEVSLVLSITNLAMVFINAVSLVLFPTIRRTKQIGSEVYLGIREVLMPVLYFAMIIYFPISFIVPLWLPKYASALQYVSIIMPMMVYQGKFEVLSNTFMKSLRMEATLMTINILTLIVSIILTVISTVLLHSIALSVFSIVLVMGFRSVLAEIILSKRMKIPYLKGIIFENIFVLGFMFVTWNYNSYVVFFGYCFVLVAFYIVKKNSVIHGMQVVKELAKY